MPSMIGSWVHSLFERVFGKTAVRDKNSDLSKTLTADLQTLIPAARAEGAEATQALARSLYQLGLEYLQNGCPAKAALALAAAEDLGAQEESLNYNLALAFSRSGQAAVADEYFERAVSSKIRDAVGDGYGLRNAYALDGVSLEKLFHRARQWAAYHTRHITPYVHDRRPSAKERLRVGLLSGRFCRHAVGFLTLGGLEHLDASRIEVVVYNNGTAEDDYTARFRSVASSWHDIAELSDESAAQFIRSHDIDVLLDMAGHSDGGRMGVIARKPALVQAKWVGGQHGTTGLAALDYFITDSVETPLEHQSYFSEKLTRLPNAYGCYTPPPDAPPVSPLPMMSRGVVTFGCFNNVAKFSDRVISVWADILGALPDSRLVFKHLALSEEETRNRIAAQFSAFGISPLRLDILPPTAQAAHLSSYADVDIALDPFPWSGCVTTCESLWMGVPVLTLPGDAFCHRHSASFLTAAGLDDWIAEDKDEYVSKAINFAQNTDALASLRSDLRLRVSNSTLCDTEKFSKDFESLLFEMSKGS